MGDATLGHVSGRPKGANDFWIKRAGIGLEEVHSRDVVLVNLNGRKRSGNGRLHVEIPLHSEIYRARAEVGGIVHVHPLCATIIGSSRKSLRPLTHEGVLFADAPQFRKTSNIISTPALGRAVARALSRHRVLFLSNHGVVVVGQDPEEACVLTILLERACHVQLLAVSLENYRWSGAREARTKCAQIYHRQALRSMWDYYVRKLKHRGRNHR